MGKRITLAWLVALWIVPVVMTACSNRTGAGEPAQQTGGPQAPAARPQPPPGRFLVGVSLFDALGTSPPQDDDLEAIKQWGMRVVRVWAHWQDPIYGADGRLTPEGRMRLDALVQRLVDRNLLMELVLLRPGQLPGQRYAVFSSPAARVQAVTDIAEALKSRQSVIFDLYNEHDHPDGPISHEEARKLRDAVKAVDPKRIVTISSTEYHFFSRDGKLEQAGLDNLRAEAGADPRSVNVDWVAAHLPRTPDWSQATAERVRRLREALMQLGRPLPVYLNEEERARPGERSIRSDVYLAAARGAREAGATGWIFHTAAGYDLKKNTMLAALSTEEEKALSLVATH